MTQEVSKKPMDAIMALCKRRGFIYQASEIYGGINGFWDYGPMGAQLKKNLRDAWWQDMILRPCWGRNGPNGRPVRNVGLETCIIQHPKVWEASGHVGGFNDPMVDCKACKSRFRADHLYSQTWADPSKFAENYLEGPDKTDDPNRVGVGLPIEARKEARERFKLQQEKHRELLGRIYRRLVLASSEGEAAQIALTGKEKKLADGLKLVMLIPLSERGYEYWPDEGCPNCGETKSLTPPRQFNLMFHSYTGATAGEDDKVYLRPETAQGVFVQFKNVVDTSRLKMPFGIGNTGRSFRNEVTPRNFTFRSREFEQAELEFFCHPSESLEWYKFWRDFRMEWWKEIGLAGENLILREHEKDELSHYSQGTSDVEYRFPFTSPGFGELEGIAHRGDYDLTQHQKVSGAKLDFFDTDRGEILPNGGKKGERYLPHCIEPAAGLDRGALALICEGYTRDDSRASPEFLKLHPRIAPVKAAVFPLVAKDGMPEVAEKLHTELNDKFWKLGGIEMDEKQSIGKRYARMDEIGTPFCITIDGDTMSQQVVTIRDRDTAQQQKVSLDKVGAFLSEKLGV
ncbi:MAG: glycine--tRNA ligase [Phycisphaerae bacterium]|nr:glycine--tRNA ligase [Phycisphaerae bacterium]